MLCEARGRPKEKILKIGKRPKGENQMTSFLIIDICIHFFITTLLKDMPFSQLSETFYMDFRYIR